MTDNKSSKTSSYLSQYIEYYKFFNKRTSALIYETLLFIMVVLSGMLVMYLIVSALLQLLNLHGSNIAFTLILFIGMFTFGLVWPIFSIVKNKQMLGYKLMKVKLIRTNGKDISRKRWLFRTVTKLIFMLIPSISFIAFVTALMITRGEKDILDFMFDTKAVEI